MTHGGTIIAKEFLKLPDFNVFAWDIYNTLDDQAKISLTSKGVKFVENSDDDFLVVAPIHIKINSNVYMTHHEAVGFIMQNKINVPVIEVTGVKGKTSVIGMLKEIFKDENPLILSSLGIEIIENQKTKILKQNISITPASIIETWKLAKNYENIGICLFETSLGGSGIADVGLLTNIVEDYDIAGGQRKASYAKKQIFNNKMNVCEFHIFNSLYSKFHKNTNTFGLDKEANVSASHIRFGLYNTKFHVNVSDLKTVDKNYLNTSFEITTFAPGLHHLKNVLSAISAALTLKVPVKKIKAGLKNFKGIRGRTSITNQNGVTVIKEINPGINVAAVEKSLDFIKNLENSSVILGGKYGITCEEIDENRAAELLNDLKNSINLIFTGELGENIKKFITRDFSYIEDLNHAIDYAVKTKSRNVLIIYRSIFSEIDKR
jgi:coenzyme F430 synthetase